ncbi:hypothetical protein [Nocardia anaemiae]|uniref:hypothetical protein n=1 Tax=Nocardia anaemiae TaxID=263910 RepID=UPI0007A4FDE1|nr:hypothetical protein [Nocardia anaemiae]
MKSRNSSCDATRPGFSTNCGAYFLAQLSVLDLVNLEALHRRRGLRRPPQYEHFRTLGIDGIVPRLNRRQVDTYPIAAAG